MEGFTVYKNAKSTRPKHYPVLVRKDLLKAEHVPTGTCQTKGCEEPVEFLRVWLCPDNPGRITVANLNGVRYCAAHAREVADLTGLARLEVMADLAEYHDQVLDIEVLVGGGRLSERLMTASVVISARNGTMHRRRDGTFLVRLIDGSTKTPCCRGVALRLIGMEPRDKSEHSTNCPTCLAGDATLAARR